jgi:hypothetical protein
MKEISMMARRTKWGVFLGLVFFGVGTFARQGNTANPVSNSIPHQPPVSEHNVVVYRQPGRYGGWPANHGIWSWGNEILVGFEAGYFKQQQQRHSINWDLPAEHLLARSLDGGETWVIEKHPDLRPPDGMKVAGVLTEPGGKPAVDCPGGINFLKPNFILTARMSDTNHCKSPSRFLRW